MWKVVPSLLWAGTCVPVSNTGLGMDGYGVQPGHVQISGGPTVTNQGSALGGSVEVGLTERVGVMASTASLGEMDYSSGLFNGTLVWRPESPELPVHSTVLAGAGVSWGDGYAAVPQPDGSIRQELVGTFSYPNLHAGWLITKRFGAIARLYGGVLLAAQFDPQRVGNVGFRLRPQAGLGGSVRPDPRFGFALEFGAEPIDSTVIVGGSLRMSVVVGKHEQEDEPSSTRGGVGPR